jgi:hypothetical protein
MRARRWKYASSCGPRNISSIQRISEPFEPLDLRGAALDGGARAGVRLDRRVEVVDDRAEARRHQGVRLAQQRAGRVVEAHVGLHVLQEGRRLHAPPNLAQPAARTYPMAARYDQAPAALTAAS